MGLEEGGQNKWGRKWDECTRQGGGEPEAGHSACRGRGGGGGEGFPEGPGLGQPGQAQPTQTLHTCRAQHCARRTRALEEP